MNNHPVVKVVYKLWEEVGKETYCGKPECDECRIIDQVTQGKGSGAYHSFRGDDPLWEARVLQVLVIDGPIPGKQYRIWIIQLTKGGAMVQGRYSRVKTPKFVIEVVKEHWSVTTGKWIYG